MKSFLIEKKWIGVGLTVLFSLIVAWVTMSKTVEFVQVITPTISEEAKAFLPITIENGSITEPQNTVIVKEYPEKYVRGENLPYYPIPTEKNKEIYEKYRQEAEKYSDFYLLGRLATYSYVNMDIAVKNAMQLIERIQED